MNSERISPFWVNGYQPFSANKVYDSKVITSEYLIENINLAFQECVLD